MEHDREKDSKKYNELKMKETKIAENTSKKEEMYGTRAVNKSQRQQRTEKVSDETVTSLL